MLEYVLLKRQLMIGTGNYTLIYFQYENMPMDLSMDEVQ